MLKTRIASLEEVAEKFRTFYAEDNGEFILDSDLRGEDVSGLKDTNKQLKSEKGRLKDQMDALQAKIDASEESGLEGREEYDKLLDVKTKQFDAKYDIEVGRAERAESALKTQMINAVISEVGSTLAGENAVLLMPHLRDRFAVELVNGDPKLQILDKDGVPGIITKDQLITEFKTNDMFKPIIKGRNSSGGGSNGGAGGSSGAVDAGTWDAFFNPDGGNYDTEKQNELMKVDKNLYSKLEKKYGLDDPYSL